MRMFRLFGAAAVGALCFSTAACSEASPEAPPATAAATRAASTTSATISGPLHLVSAKLVTRAGAAPGAGVGAGSGTDTGSGTLVVDRNCLAVQRSDGSRSPLVLPWYHTYEATESGVLIDGTLKLEVGAALPRHTSHVTSSEVVSELNGGLDTLSSLDTLKTCSQLGTEFIAITSFYDLPQPE